LKSNLKHVNIINCTLIALNNLYIWRRWRKEYIQVYCYIRDQKPTCLGRPNSSVVGCSVVTHWLHRFT